LLQDEKWAMITKLIESKQENETTLSSPIIEINNKSTNDAIHTSNINRQGHHAEL